MFHAYVQRRRTHRRFMLSRGVSLARLGTVLLALVALAGTAEAHSAARARGLRPRADRNGPCEMGRKPSKGSCARLLTKIRVHGYRLPRTEIWPDLGSSVYVFSARNIKDLPLGKSTSLQQLLIQAPGIYQEEFGTIHIRGEHANIQYRIDGVYVPSQLISGFGSVLSTRFARSVTVLTGTLPAEYGYRTAGVIDIETPTGGTEPGLHLSLLTGSHDTWSPTVTWGGASGRWDWFLSGTYYRSALGLGSPTPASTPPHDVTRQGKGFAYLSWRPWRRARLMLINGDVRAHYQIPNTPGQVPLYSYEGESPSELEQIHPSQDLDETQDESNRFTVLALQGTGEGWGYSLAYFNRLLTTHYRPDPIGDLVYQGVAGNVFESSMVNGLQVDLDRRLDRSNRLGFGLFLSHEHARDDDVSAVFPANASGAQTSDVPETIVDDHNSTGWTYGVYVQDTWRPIRSVHVDYGLRGDVWDGTVRAGQISPRIAVVWSPARGTRLHVGYARYFSPPSLYDIPQKSLAKFVDTTNASPVNVNSASLPQRSNYYDVGIVHDFGRRWSVGLDTFYQHMTDALDVGQLGNALVFAYFNYAQGRIKGASLSVSYHGSRLGGYLNLTYLDSRAKDVITGQYNFPPAELAYVDAHYFHVDHSQPWTGSAGVHYFWARTLFSADLTYASGYPTGFANLESLPSYATVNLGVAHGWRLPWVGRITTRLSVVNLFDRVYELRNGTGLGISAPYYLPRRSFYLVLGKTFAAN
jgi:hypothetical protein